jgi:hypothetical protein
MATRFCSFCGQPLPGQGTFCPSCGAAVPGAAAPTAGTPPMPTFLPPTSYIPGAVPSASGAPGPTTQAQDREALSRVSLAAALTIVGVVVGIAISALSNLGGLVSATSGASGVLITLPSPWLWVGIIGVDAAIEVAGLVLYRSAFHALAPVDRRFSTPSALALAAIVGIVIALAGLGLLLDALYQAVQCVGSGNPITRDCLLTGTFWGGLALAAVGGIIALVGYIGVLIGIWRLGTRYSESLFKIGAVLLIFPYLNLVGAILILAGAHGASGRVASGGMRFP